MLRKWILAAAVGLAFPLIGSAEAAPATKLLMPAFTDSNIEPVYHRRWHRPRYCHRVRVRYYAYGRYHYRWRTVCRPYYRRYY